MGAGWMNTFSSDDNLDNDDSTDKNNCFKIPKGQFDSLLIQMISLFSLWKGLHELSVDLV